MLGSGAVVLVSLPFAFILLCITVIGIPLAVLSALAVSVLLIAAVPFTGASLAREFIPQWNKLAASLAGAAALVILVHIPYIGIIVRAGSWIYILGYCLQRMWQGRSRREIRCRDPGSSCIYQIPPGHQKRYQRLPRDQYQRTEIGQRRRLPCHLLLFPFYDPGTACKNGSGSCKKRS